MAKVVKMKIFCSKIGIKSIVRYKIIIILLQLVFKYLCYLIKIYKSIQKYVKLCSYTNYNFKHEIFSHLFSSVSADDDKLMLSVFSLIILFLNIRVSSNNFF